MAVFEFDPGHGGYDPGALGVLSNEAANVLKVALKVGKELQRHGHTVYYTRTKDTFVSLSARAAKANRDKVDYFVSFHNNAAVNKSATGFETFIYSGTNNSETKRLQKVLHNAIAVGIGIRDRGMKRANFAVLRQTNMAAVLIEYAFISNTSDEKILVNQVNKLADLTVNGLLELVGTKKKSSGSSKSNASTSKPKASKPQTKATTTKPSGNLGLVDWMKSQKMDSSFNNRKKLAGQHGISNYKGTAKQNTSLLNKLKGGSSGSSSSSSSKKYPLPTGVLRRGSTGNDVKQLQRALNAANFNVGKVDGVYGEKTEDAVRRFQMVYDAYNVDGDYGSRTRTRLDKQVN